MVENAHPEIISMKEWDELKKQKHLKHGKPRGPSKVDSSRWLFTGHNAIGEMMFECLNCNSSLSSGQSKRVYSYYICSGNKNQGEAKCSAKCYVPKDWIENEVINIIKQRFNPKYIDKLVNEINKAIAEEKSDQIIAIKHLEKSIAEKDKAIQNLVIALTKLSNPQAIETLSTQLEDLEQEKSELENNLAELKKDTPDKKLDKHIILELVNNLETVMLQGSNTERREIVRRFIRRLELNPNEGCVYVTFWPDPFGQDRERLKLVKKNNPGPSNEDSGSYEMGWCRRPELNRYDCYQSRDFKSRERSLG